MDKRKNLEIFGISHKYSAVEKNCMFKFPYVEIAVLQLLQLTTNISRPGFRILVTFRHHPVTCNDNLFTARVCVVRCGCSRSSC